METKITTSVELITPSKAQEYLTRNVNNRRLREIIVNVYADSMKRGLWRLSNDAICFTKSGKLINGQHRLQAICKSGCSAKFNVSRGYDEDDIMVMDNGVARSSGDVLYLQGIENSNTISGVIKRKLILNKSHQGIGKYNHSNDKILNSVVNEEYFAHEEFYQDVVLFAKNCYRKLRVMAESEYGGISAHLILDLNHSEEEVKSFFKEFVGANPETNGAIGLLRSKLVNDKISKAKMSATMKQKLIIKTWNAYITGKSVRQLQYNEILDKDIWFI